MVEDRAISTKEKRKFFPRGLLQSETGFRFSMDSLLLACFATARAGQRGLDLGCGCGVIGLGLMLRHDNLVMTGLELDPENAEFAARNGAALGFGERFAVVHGDVAEYRAEPVYDFVVANPPYREPGTGRESEDPAKRVARFETGGSLEDFAACAARCLKTRGRFAVVHLAERLPELLHALLDNGLAPKRLRLIHSRVDEPARLVLVETVKAGGPGLSVEPPLIVYAGQGDATALTDQALEFCPFLACNAKQGE